MITREDNEHHIPHIFKGLDSYRTAYRLDTVFIEMLEERNMLVPTWLSYMPYMWLEKIERYENKDIIF